MALKEKALKRLAEKLNAAGVPWVLSGDYALVLRGIDAQWHGFELITDTASVEQVDRILTRLGMRHEEDAPVCRTVSYHFDGADVQLLCGPDVTLTSDMQVAVLGVSVPLLAPDQQLRLFEKQ